MACFQCAAAWCSLRGAMVGGIKRGEFELLSYAIAPFPLILEVLGGPAVAPRWVFRSFWLLNHDFILLQWLLTLWIISLSMFHIWIFARRGPGSCRLLGGHMTGGWCFSIQEVALWRRILGEGHPRNDLLFSWLSNLIRRRQAHAWTAVSQLVFVDAKPWMWLRFRLCSWSTHGLLLRLNRCHHFLLLNQIVA